MCVEGQLNSFDQSKILSAILKVDYWKLYFSLNKINILFLRGLQRYVCTISGRVKLANFT